MQVLYAQYKPVLLFGSVLKQREMKRSDDNRFPFSSTLLLQKGKALGKKAYKSALECSQYNRAELEQ